MPRVRTARSEATTPSSSPPPRHCRASPENQLSQDGRLHTGRGVVDEHELVDHALDTLLIYEGARKQQGVEQEQDKGNTEDEDKGPQQEMNIVAPVVTAERPGGSPRPANRRQSLPNLNPSPETSHNEAGSRSGGDSDDELNSTDSVEDDEKKPRPAKRKQLSSSHDGLTRKKRRRPLQESSSRQRRPLFKPYRQYLKSHSPLDQCSRVATSSSAKGRLPSSAPSMPQSIDTKMSLGDSNLSPSSRATHRRWPRSRSVRTPHTATPSRRLSGTVVTGEESLSPSWLDLSRAPAIRHTSSSITAEAGNDHVDATRTRPQDGKAVDVGAFTSRGGEPSSSDNDESGLSDSDPELGSDGDGGGCSSEDELGRSYRRAAVAGVQEGGQVVEMDLPPVPRQDSACSTHTFEHRTGQRRVDFLARVDRRLLVRTCPLTSVRMNRATYRAWLEKVFSPVVVNAMPDTEVEAMAFEPLSAKCQRELLENHIKKLQDRHKIFRGAIGNEADLVLDGAPSTILQHSRTINTKTFTQQGSEPASSDDDSCLSDDDGCSNEQRLLAYWKEDKPWSWIFQQFSNRTPPVVHALEHASAQKRIGFLQVDWYKQLKLCCLLVPWFLLGRRSERSLILLWASPIAAASTVEGSGVQSEEDWWMRCMGGTPQRKWGLTSRADMRHDAFL
ncbi:hypothetical protein B0J14DRAFT_571244 [Halenospora varia]|nr:hypothetical protein B0J14DRAFT_571244 [Halenospora varia]